MTIDVKDLVANRLVELAPSVCTSVVDTLAQVEHDKRVEAFLYVVGEVDKSQKELNKFKPDQVAYDVDGKVISETYSKNVLDSKAKVVKRLAELNAALDATEADPRDFTKVTSLHEKAGKKE